MYDGPGPGIYYLNHATTFQVLDIKKLDFKMYEKV